MHASHTSAALATCHGHSNAHFGLECQHEDHAAVKLRAARLKFAGVQGDLWQWFLEPSLYGTDVLTLGGSRGPSVSYYVPYLSAMQLLVPFLPASPQQPGASDTAAADMPQAAAPPQQTQQSTAQQGVEGQATAEQTHRDRTPQSGPDTALPRACRQYHVEDQWQQWSSQVIQEFISALRHAAHRIVLH